jgi:hypothetical protein
MTTEAEWIKEWTALAAIGTALAAILVGPIVSSFVTRAQNKTALTVAQLQFTASVVSANRMNWINGLRDAVSEFLGTVWGYPIFPGTTTRSPESIHDAQNAYSERVSTLRSQIALLINPNEEDHRNLLTLVDRAMSVARVHRDQEFSRAAAEIHHEITATAQGILKREWERVKEGEPTNVQRA